MDIAKGILSSTTDAITTDVYVVTPIQVAVSQPEPTVSIEMIDVFTDEDIVRNHSRTIENDKENPLFYRLAKTNEEMNSHGLIVEKKNGNGSGMSTGWYKSSDPLSRYEETVSIVSGNTDHEGENENEDETENECDVSDNDKSFWSELINDNKITGFGWILGILLIGVFYIVVGWLYYCDGNECSDGYRLLLYSSLFQFFIAFLEEFFDTFHDYNPCNIFALILSYIVFLLSSTGMFGIKGPVVLITISSVYNVVAISIVFKRQLIQDCPHTMLSLLISKELGFVIVFQWCVGIFAFLHFFFLFYAEFPYVYFGLFLAIDSGVYTVVSFLETYDNDGIVYKSGVFLGFIWGIFSLILSIIASSVYQKIICLLLSAYT